MSAKHKISILIILSILLITGVKLFLPEPEENTELINEFWIKKTFQKTKKNIVVGGDSRVYNGISINKLQQGIKQKCSGLNLGYLGAGFSPEYLDFLLSRLDLNSQPKIMILGITPHSLTEKAAKNEAFHQYKDIDRKDRYIALYLSKYLKQLAPYKPWEIVKKLKYRNTNEVGFANFTSTGWVASYKFPADSLQALVDYTRTFNKYKISQNVIDELLLKITEIKKMNVSIIAFRVPSTYQMEKLEKSLSGFDEEYLKKEFEKAGAFWLEFNNSDFVSYDGSHLHYLSAEKLSLQLGEKIDKILLRNKI